ncbi:MAG: ABC transporter ATP-binding protein [Anaerolineae bacterium]|nr:ABC transporter ATP-binding protein [Anaerolineae bacterium]
MNSEPIVEIKGVSKTFTDSHNNVHALTNVDLEFWPSTFNVIIGPSGCGKSTLLYLVAGFETPTTGQVILNGEEVKEPGPDRGFVFQDYALFPWRTVLGNITFGLTNNGWKRKEAIERAREYIRLMNLEGFENAFPHTLSGGMKQRVGIARALAYDPLVLLMDEPFGALDAQTRKYMQQELVRIWQETKKTVLFITHSVIEAVYLADRIVVMTARPGQVKGIVDVDLPRPRNYTGDDYLEVREKVLSLLEEEVAKGIKDSLASDNTLFTD